MLRKVFVVCGLLASLALCGCVTGSGSPSGGHGRGKVQLIDHKTRVHNQATLDHTDFIQFADQITNKMLESRLVRSWGDSRPRIIVGKVLNNTDEERLRHQDITDKINEVLLNSGVVRIMDQSALNFDYIVRTELNSSREKDSSGEEIVTYNMVLKLFSASGELQGQWSDYIKMVKAGRSLF
ncbi:hypothetical protein [Desulfobaculum sp.]|jgi:hypothetical protein